MYSTLIGKHTIMSSFEPQNKKWWGKEPHYILDDDKEYLIKWLKKHHGQIINDDLIQEAKKQL